jgi:hypothetical protein
LQVEFVLEWTSSAGFELSAAVPGPGGFTPMHLATLLDDDGRITVLLTCGPLTGFLVFCHLPVENLGAVMILMLLLLFILSQVLCSR